MSIAQVNACSVIYLKMMKREEYLSPQSVEFMMGTTMVRTPLCKISSTGEIEQRFRLN